MNPIIRHAVVLVVAITFNLQTTAQAQYLDQIGVTILRATTTNLNGAGIRVAQPEAQLSTNPPTWEVYPAVVSQPTNLFTYISSAGSSTNYTNSLGVASSHAGDVGKIFYGMPGGVATNLAHVDNYLADDFYNDVIGAVLPPDINDRVVNQSFIFGSVPSQVTVAQQQAIDSDYDNYVAKYKTLFVSGAGNGGSVCPPATCYNGLGVAAYGGASSVGPTVDNGRAKPDITAPAGATSYSTPQVAGAAAVLMQAALRGGGGSDTNSAADIRTVKALLLNGAVKPTNWVNSSISPLDTRYGAGVLNVFNSYEQLAGGKRNYIENTTVSTGGLHPPAGAAGSIGVLNGWDYNTNSSGSSSDSVNHYYFNVTNDAAGTTFSATATLVWNRQQNKSDINNLDLFLYNCANSNLVTCSTSLVDNVEHIFVPQLAPGRYDLQVWKAGGAPVLDIVSAAEPYALAFAFTTTELNIAFDGANPVLTWPAYPAGFRVEWTTNLSSPVWSTNQLSAAMITNSQNYLLLNPTNSAQFFRLHQQP